MYTIGGMRAQGPGSRLGKSIRSGTATRSEKPGRSQQVPVRETVEVCTKTDKVAGAGTSYLQGLQKEAAPAVALTEHQASCEPKRRLIACTKPAYWRSPCLRGGGRHYRGRGIRKLATGSALGELRHSNVTNSQARTIRCTTAASQRLLGLGGTGAQAEVQCRARHGQQRQKWHGNVTRAPVAARSVVVHPEGDETSEK